MKIKQIICKNFRGAKDSISLITENGHSLLLYGDNGTGKSSFADAVEWFVADKVSHLDGEEIEKYGGLRNALSKQTDECSVEIDFVSGKKGKKTLGYVKEKLKPEYLDRASVDLTNILLKERILVRNRDLVYFVLATKTIRLLEVSAVIGFEEVIRTKDTLKKAASGIKSEKKRKNFEGQIANKKGLIFQKLHTTVNNQEQFYSAVDSQVKSFDFGFEVKDRTTFLKAIDLLKIGVDPNELRLKTTLELAKKKISDALSKLAELDLLLKDISEEISEIQRNQENLKQISIARLLEEAAHVMTFHDKDECPLCQQGISRQTLLALITDRLLLLKHTQQKIKSIQDAKQDLFNSLTEVHQELKSQLKNLHDLSIADLGLESSFDYVNAVQNIITEFGKEPTDIDAEQLHLKKGWQGHFEELQNKISEILQNKVTDNLKQQMELYASISVAEVTFNEIEKLEREKTIIEEQEISLDKILSNFIAVQRNEMKSFLSSITAHLNEYFLFMNQAELIDEVELSTVDDSEGEFAGISIQFKFHGQLVSPPKKFLSESYLNCLGLCFFLASVKLFNKQSKFFILDDVISSFDKKHRMRFGQLLIEKFSDYQILVFTHELEWFNFMANLARGHQWKITETKFNAKTGISLEVSARELKPQIEQQFADNNAAGLGNRLRKYAERTFKELCSELEAQVKFKFNDQNEHRMLDELFSCLRGRLKEKTNLAGNNVVDRVAGSKFITNQASHDSSYLTVQSLPLN